jgi:hypothetical protein
VFSTNSFHPYYRGGQFAAREQEGPALKLLALTPPVCCADFPPLEQERNGDYLHFTKFYFRQIETACGSKLFLPRTSFTLAGKAQFLVP